MIPDTGKKGEWSLMKKKKKLFSKLTAWTKFPGCSKGRGNPSRTQGSPWAEELNSGVQRSWGGWSLHGSNPDSKKVSRERTPDTYTESPTSIHTAKDCSRHPREETLRGWAKNPPLFPHWKLEGRLWPISQRQETVLTLDNQNLKSQTWWGHWLEY